MTAMKSPFWPLSLMLLAASGASLSQSGGTVWEEPERPPAQFATVSRTNAP